MPIIWKEELLFSGVSRMRKWVLRNIVKLVQSPFCRQASFVLLCSITRWEPLLVYIWCDDCDYLKRLNMKWECFISAISTALMSILSLLEVKLQIFIILLCLGCLTFFFHLCTYYYLCTSGIWLHESGVLGASPDGFVQGDFRKTDIVHLQQNDQPATLPTIIEVKCPFTAKDKTIMEVCSSVKDFFLGS